MIPQNTTLYYSLAGTPGSWGIVIGWDYIPPLRPPDVPSPVVITSIGPHGVHFGYPHVLDLESPTDLLFHTNENYAIRASQATERPRTPMDYQT